MAVEYPLEFKLENGIHVVIDRVNTNTYSFTLTPEEGLPRQFTHVEDGRTKTEIEENMDFDQLNAIRRFWLENEEAS